MQLRFLVCVRVCLKNTQKYDIYIYIPVTVFYSCSCVPLSDHPKTTFFCLFFAATKRSNPWPGHLLNCGQQDGIEALQLTTVSAV